MNNKMFDKIIIKKKSVMVLRLFLLVSIVFLQSCSEKDVDITVIETPDAVEEEMDSPVDEDTDGVESTGEWLLVFEDEFDDETLPLWNIWEGGAFNNEIQLYRPSQLTVENSMLTINVKREAISGDTTPFDSTQKDFEYVSSRLETKSQFGPSSDTGENNYRFVASIQLPEGNGMWPAFWSFGDDWPINGEIDILEARGNEPMNFQSNIFYGQQVGMPETMEEDTSTRYTVDVDLTAGFNTYELIWSENNLEVYLNSVLLKRYEASDKNFINNLFGKKHNIVLNSAVGGVFFPPNADSATFADEAMMMVDWVRVYKR